MAHILVVDDSAVDRTLAGRILERNSEWNIVYAGNGKEAVARLESQAPDLIITDLKMKEIDGMQFLTEAKKRHPATEVIVITGFATMETAKQSFQKGVFDFIAKPFKLSEIQEVVNRAAAKIRGAA